MGTPNYKLHYFDVRGRGELIRMIFAEKRIPFEDIRVTNEEWKTLKRRIPGGQLPFLEVDGDIMYESLAIARYLAREYDLYGNSNRAMQKVDEILDIATDVMLAFYTAVFEKDEAKRKTMLRDVKENNYRQFLARMEKKLEVNKSGFLVGSSVTIADFFVYNILCNVIDIMPNIWDEAPECKEHFDRVSSLPNIKAWLDKHPRSEF